MADSSSGLEAYGWDDTWADAFDAVDAGPTASPGRVVRHDGVAVRVATADGVTQMPMRGGVPPLAVGDWVIVDDGAVVAQLPRRNAVRRRDVDKDTEQILAAGVDLVVAVCGLDRPVRQGRIHRTGLLAADAGADFAVVLTKADVVADGDEVAQRIRTDNPNAVVHVCALGVPGDPRGLESVAALLRGSTTVMVGESGAGKSTLTNALLGDEVAATGHVRAGDSKGRHTTTSRELHLLPGGGVLVDSPGIRSVGVFADDAALAETFEDIDDLARQCRFRDCTHGVEPGCAVREAVEAGTLDPDRFNAWRGFADDQPDERGRRPSRRRDYGETHEPT